MDTTTHQDIKVLADEYKEVLEKERFLRFASAKAARELEERRVEVIAEAIAEERINGKNAEARAIQTESILGADDKMLALSEAKENIDIDLGKSEVDRRYNEALISLTKAWLYSQSGVI